MIVSNVLRHVHVKSVGIYAIDVLRTKQRCNSVI